LIKTINLKQVKSYIFFKKVTFTPVLFMSYAIPADPHAYMCLQPQPHLVSPEYT